MGSAFPPIEDYAFLSDCRSAALVSLDGAIEWLCWPRFDSPSLFAALLDREQGGHWTLRPTGDYRVSRAYQPGTNVLETCFETETGSLRVHDFLHMGRRQALCRLVRGVQGEVEMTHVFAPRADYGRAELTFSKTASGWQVAEHAGRRLVLAGAHGGLQETFIIGAGQRRAFSLGLGAPGPSDIVHARMRAIEAWRDWSEQIVYEGPHRELVERSALVLKGLQYAPTGAIVAAPTTSLPERVGGKRNWDYRFAWLRDSAFTLFALDRLGLREEAHSWADWLDRISFEAELDGREADELQIMYAIDGGAEIPESELEHLSGYRGSRPVRIGNGAAGQLQLDVPGEVLDALWLLRRRSKLPLTEQRWRLVCRLADRAVAQWRSPDNGIWEMRGVPQHFVFSKVMCWVALDRALKLARIDDRTDAPVDLWRAERQAIRADVEAHGYDERRGAYTQAYGNGELDASSLLMARVGFLPASDPRFVATVKAIEAELTEDGLVHRYRAVHADDGLEGDEGAFSICTLWLVLALIEIGDVDEAETLFERFAQTGSDLGLFAEEVDPRGTPGDRQLGNYPQAFTHVALIVCAHALARRLRPARGRIESTAAT